MLHSNIPKMALVLATVIWGGSYVMMKNATDSIPTNYLLAFRFTGASIILSVIFNKSARKINKTYLKHGSVMGTALFLAYTFQTIGLKDTTPGKSAFLTAVYCVVVPFIAYLYGKEKIDKYNFIAAGACIAGIGLVSIEGGMYISRGDVWTLVGGFFFAVHMITIAMFTGKKGADFVTLTIVQFMTAAVYTWIMAISFETFPTGFGTDTILELGYLIVFATAGCLLLQSFGQTYTTASSASLILSLESVFGVLFSVIFYKEKVTLKMIAGFVLIFFSIVVSETKLAFLSKESVTEAEKVKA
ncbi:MAG: DMT family transporter [Eubacteriaceae bacterium]|nr:DMT family transporter [Eubacteriaceae bacterium]